MMTVTRSLLARTPLPVRLGLPLAAALMAAACGSSGGSSPSSSSPAAATGNSASAGASQTMITTRSGPTGTYLTDSSGRAIYLFMLDSMNTSKCSGACAAIWPPVTAKGSVSAGGSAVASDLGTITRSDGTKQVTYNGHPLYFYAADSGAGETKGQGITGFGAKWWLVAPSGKQLTGSSGSQSSAPSSGSTGGSGSWG